MTPTPAPMTPDQVAAVAVIASATTAAVLALFGILAATAFLTFPHLRHALDTWRATRHLNRHETAGTGRSDDQDVRDWFDRTRRAIDALPTTDHPTDD